MRSSRLALVALVIVLLAAAVLAPRLVAGYMDIAQADALRADHPLDAAAHYESAAQRLPWRMDLWEQAGRSALAGGDANRAVTLLDEAARRNALSDAGRLALGDAYLEAGEEQMARTVWESMRSRGQTSPGLYLRIAQYQERLGEYDPGAIESWRALIVLEPGDAQAHYHLGLILSAEDPQKALPELIESAQRDSSLDANVRVLRTAINTGLLQDDTAYQLLLAGRALGAIGEWPLAQLAFENALRHDRQYAEAWAWLGEAGAHNGLNDLSHQYLEYALALDPNSASIQALYGLYWQRQQDPENALLAFQKAIHLEPQNPAWYAAVGNVRATLGDLSGALASYQRAVDLAPKDAAYWRLLALFCADHSTLIVETGLPAAFTAVQIEKDNPVNLDVLGRLLLEAGYSASAETILKRAVAAAPDSPGPHLHLGLLYLQQGRSTLAYPEIVKAHDLDPNGPVGTQAQRVLERYFFP
jgi:tetratricopeptide (TPR) repeat protein